MRWRGGGQRGIARLTFVFFELVFAVLVVAALIYVVVDQNTVISHPQLDKELALDVLEDLPGGMKVTLTEDEPLEGGLFDV
jgi:hypothetical protein